MAYNPELAKQRMREQLQEQSSANFGGPALAGVRPERAVQAIQDERKGGPAADGAMFVEGKGTGGTPRGGAIPDAVARFGTSPAKAAAVSDDFDGLRELADGIFRMNKKIKSIPVVGDFFTPAMESGEALGTDLARLFRGQENKPAEWYDNIPGFDPQARVMGSIVKDLFGIAISPLTGALNVGIQPAAEGLSHIPVSKVDKETGAVEPLSREERKKQAEEALWLSAMGLAARPRVAGPRAAASEPPPSKPTPPPEGPKGGAFELTPEGFVASPEGGPATFATAKEAGLWYHKNARGVDQLFEVANGPNGGFVVKQRGVRVNEPPPPGANPAVDKAYAQKAEAGAEALKEIETTLASTKTFSRDPVLASEFVAQTAPESIVQIPPSAIYNIWKNDPDAFPGAEWEGQLDAANTSGRNVEIPLAKYLEAVTGKPWADALREQVIFDEGVSLAQAKELAEGKPEPFELKLGGFEDVGQKRQAFDLKPTDPKILAEPNEFRTGIGGAVLENGDFRINSSGLPASARGQGLGTAMYERLIAEAAKRGGKVISDNEVSIEAARVYDKLEAKGYVVTRNPNAVLSEEGNWTTEDRSPVFTVEKGEAVAAEPVGLSEQEAAVDALWGEAATSEAGWTGVADLAAEAQRATRTAVKHHYLSALFKDGKAVNMTETQFRLYGTKVETAIKAAHEKMIDKIRRQIKKENEPEFKEQLKQNVAAVEQTFFERQDFQAYWYLRYNQHPNGAPVEKPFKLSRDVTKALFGQKADLLPNTLFGRDGMNPEDVAELFGYSNGTQMIDDLIGVDRAVDYSGASSPKDYLKKIVKAQATNLTRVETGFDSSPEGIMAMAREAVASPQVTDLLIDELQSLATAQKLPFDKETVQAKAVEMFGELPVKRAMNIREFERILFRLGREAEIALLKNKLPEAFVSKQRQLLNHYMLIEAHKFTREYARGMKRMTSWAKRGTIPGQSQEYLNNIHSMLARHGFRVSRDADELLRAVDYKTPEEFVQKLMREGHSVVYHRVPEDQSLWTADDFRLYWDMMKNWDHLGRETEYVKIAGERVEFEALLQEIRDAAANLPDKPGQLRLGGHKTDVQRLKDLGMGLDAGMRKVEDISDFMDFNNPDGAFNRVLVQGAHRAADKKGLLVRDIGDPIGKAFWKIPKEVRSQQHTYLEDSPFLYPKGTELEGQPIPFQRGTLLPVMLNMGTESNLTKLAEGYGTTPAEIEAFVNAHATKEEWDYVRFVWESLKGLLPEIERVERARTGLGLTRVKERKVPTAFGEIDGGYYPVVYDPNWDMLAAERADVIEDDPFLSRLQFAATPVGHLKPRTKYVGPLFLSLDGVLLRHLDDVFTRIAYAEYVRDALKVVNNREVRNLISTKMGKAYYSQIYPWLRDQVADRVMSIKELGKMEKFLRAARINWQVTVMGLSWSTGSSQTLGLGSSAAYIGENWLASGLQKQAALMKEGGFKAVTDFVYSRSPMMELRNGDVDRDLRDALLSVHSFEKTNSLRSAVAKSHRLAMWHIGMMDRWTVAVPTWLGAYNKVYAEYQPKPGQNDWWADRERKAVEYANKAVRQSQGSGRVADQARIQRGSEFIKPLTLAYTYFGSVYNRKIEGLYRAKKQGDEAKFYQHLFWFIFALPILNAWWSHDRPKDLSPEEIAPWIANKLFFGLFNEIPGIREGSNYASRKFEGEYASTASKTPLGQAMESTVKTATGKGRTKDNFTTFGLLTGVGGMGQIGKTIGFLKDVLEGDESPESFEEWMDGLTRGRSHDDFVEKG